jgi:DNA-binding transcriptional LysR family regulator
MYDCHLEDFVRVADAGSFSKAAEQLYISTTAIIKKINQLEDRLGVVLFVRTHKGVTLTSAGRTMYQDAKYIMHYTSIAISRAKQATLNDKSIIRVGQSLITPSDFLVELWPRIQEHCPELQIRIVPYENTPEIVSDLLENIGKDIDVFAGLFDPTMLEYRKCAALGISNQAFKCAIPMNHHLAKKRRLQISDLFGEKLMLVEPGKFLYFDVLRNDIISKYPEIKIIDFASFNIAAFNQCENNNCILVVIGPWRNIHPLLKTKTITWEYSTPYGIIHSRNPSPQVSKFLTGVEKALNIFQGDSYLL